MKHIKIITTILLASWLFAACENEGFFYQDEARIRMEGNEDWTVGTDSLLFSFVTQPSGVTEFDIEVTLYIMGVPASHNRTANIGLVAGRTTAQSSQYSFPQQVTVPAGESSATFVVTLKRTADLLDTTVSLQIRVLDSDDFKVGAVEQSHLLLKWNDILSMPPNWVDDFEEFFGAYSQGKYRFMLENGVPELTESNLSWGALMNYKIMLQNVVAELTAQGNPPRDENQNLITF